MENQKNNNGVIVLLIVIIVILSALCILFATGTISFNVNKEKDDTVNEDNMLEQKEYNADDYIVLEDVVFNSKVSTKKVKLKNLDDSITKDFYAQQEEVINSIHVSDSEVFNAEYKLKYFINNNILSILYTIEESHEIGTCATKMAVTNIDLKNNKVISEEELLRKVGVSYNSLVEDAYEQELDSWKKHNDNIGFEMSYYEVTFADFRDNKSKYISQGVKELPNIIYTYIEDGKIKYDYYTIHLDTLFHQVGKGGCFNWNTITLGDY